MDYPKSPWRDCAAILLLALPLNAAPPPAIAFHPIPDQILGTPPFIATAQATSGLPVALSSTTPVTCKVASSLITLVAPGICTITATQAGASTVTQSFTVNPARPSGALTSAPGSPFAVGANASAVAVGDFNLDGKPDIATANGNANTVSVLLGDGAGGFSAAPASPFAAGTGVQSPVVADFNGDGFPDIAVANSAGVTVLLGNGMGGFPTTVAVPLAPGTSPVSLAVGDFNGDGIADLAVADRTMGVLIPLLGNGRGGFAIAPGGPVPLGASHMGPVSIAVGDFNGDGIQDLATANQVSANVAVLFGDGAGGFTLGPSFFPSTGAQPFSIAAGDFNGDGNLDLATADNGGNSVTVLLGNGAGGFSAAPGSPFAVASPWSLAVGDINGDGNPDIVVGTAGAGVSVLIGNGRGAFTVTSGPATMAIPISAALADFNGDGIVDVVTANYSAGSVSVMLGGATVTTLTLTTPQATVSVGQPVPLTAAISVTGLPFFPPTGTVTFMDGAGMSGAGLLGAATQTVSPYTFSASGLSGGSHTLTAMYSGDNRTLPALSNALAVQEGGPTPAVTTLSPANWPAGGASFTLTVNGTGFVAASLVLWNGTALTTKYVGATQLTAMVPASDLSSAGTAGVEVASPWADSNTVLTAALLPALTTLAPAAGWLAGGAAFTLTVNGAGFVAASQVQWNGSPLVTRFVSAMQLTASVTAASLSSAGPAAITVVNAPGAVSNAIQYAAILPAIASLNPAGWLPGGPDFTLTVTGTGFSSNSQVLWNGSPLTTRFISATQLTAAVPAGTISSAGSTNISVTNAPGAVSNSLNYAATLPAVTSLNPAGWLVGGVDFTLTVNGTGFVQNSQVLWNGAALVTKFVSATQLTASVSSATISSAGVAGITISNAPGATSNSTQYPDILPALTSLSPAAWLVGGPDFTLTVKGTGFVPNSQVEWNGSALTTKLVGATQLTATVPAPMTANPVAVSIAVTNATGAVSNTLPFAAAAPTVATLSPSAAIATGPDFKLCVTGAGFGSAATVQWNGTALATTFVSTTNLCATVTADLIAAPGSASISILNPDGSVSKSAALPVNLPVPAVTQAGIVPIYSSRSVIQPGSWVSIFGTNLANGTFTWNGDFPTSLGGTSVTIDGKPAYLWAVTPTQINLQAPDDTTTGSVKVVVTTPFGPVTSTVTLAANSPSLSLWPGSHYPAAVILTPDGSGADGNGTYDLLGPTGNFTFSTRPVKAGETLSLYGVGFGPTNPAVPAGAVFSGAAPAVAPATVTIGGMPAKVLFCGLTGAGLYQITVVVPKTASGDQILLAKVGVSSTQTGLFVTVK